MLQREKKTKGKKAVKGEGKKENRFMALMVGGSNLVQMGKAPTKEKEERSLVAAVFVSLCVV